MHCQCTKPASRLYSFNHSPAAISQSPTVSFALSYADSMLSHMLFQTFMGGDSRSLAPSGAYSAGSGAHFSAGSEWSPRH